MVKRFTCTEKWKKKWFRNLDDKSRLFWIYVLDNCDHAGIWEVDFELVSVFIKDIQESKIREDMKKQFHEIDNGKKWFIPDFVEFQYGVLKPESSMHRSVIGILNKNRVLPEWYHPGTRDKDKDKVKDKVSSKGIVKGEIYPSDEDIKKLWDMYPRKLGHTKAVEHMRAKIKTPQDMADCLKAIVNYKKEIERLKTEEQFIKHGSTFFNKDWRDYINMKEPEKVYYTPDGIPIR